MKAHRSSGDVTDLTGGVFPALWRLTMATLFAANHLVGCNSDFLAYLIIAAIVLGGIKGVFEAMDW